MATVRYIVRDVDAAVGFYRDRLGFVLEQQFGPAMAIVRRDDLSLWLAGPQASASRPIPDGRTPEPGGWARIVVEVADLDATVAELRSTPGTFRSDIIAGPGGRQCLIEDPSGNAVELFEPRR
ncbi:MAG: VOC family protein [Hyphomicrobiales bacterium]|nr:VOC family protein [Hyphomicrobiales bacterium]